MYLNDQLLMTEAMSASQLRRFAFLVSSVLLSESILQLEVPLPTNFKNPSEIYQ